MAGWRGHAAQFMNHTSPFTNVYDVSLGFTGLLCLDMG